MSSDELRLFVGLGNPGTKFSGTRHNIGFMVLEKLAKKKAVSFRYRNKLHGLLAEVNSGPRTMLLLMPNTFMNESGRAIRATLDWFGLEVDQLLVLVDDMDLPLGRLRLRTKGSAGGHNGLKSTIKHLGTENFSRLRIGIGPPICMPEERKEKTIPHVLGTFSAKEAPVVSEVLNEVISGLDAIHQLDLAKVITRLNSFKPDGFPSN